MIANDVKQGVKTWDFWLKGTLEAVIGGFAGGAYGFLSNLASQGVGLDTGEMVSLQGFLAVSVIGAGVKVFDHLRKFKIPE